MATDGGRVWKSIKNQQEGKSDPTGRLSNRKILGKSWELPTSKRVTSDTFVFLVVVWLVGWLKAGKVTASITNKPLGSVCQLEFHASKFWASKLTVKLMKSWPNKEKTLVPEAPLLVENRKCQRSKERQTSLILRHGSSLLLAGQVPGEPLLGDVR